MQRAIKTRTGWRQEETELLWNEVKRAGGGGGTLREAFDVISQQTGRKPNSIRNFYYQSIKDQEAPEELCTLRAQPFVPFASEQVQEMLRTILKEKAQGVSVRSCVAKMAGGDRALALRYQNKYRSILKSHPDMIQAMMQELSEQGIVCQSPYDTLCMRRKTEPARMAKEDTALGQSGDLLDTLKGMIQRGDLVQERRHREEMDRMSVRCDLLRLELARREELLIEAQYKQQTIKSIYARASGLMEVCQEILSTQDIAVLESTRKSLRESVEQLEQAMHQGS